MLRYVPKESNWTLIKTCQQKNQLVITLMNVEEFESINVTRTYEIEANKHKYTSSRYDNKGEKKTLSTSEEK